MPTKPILIDIDNTLFDGYYMFKAIENELKAGIFSPAAYTEVQKTLIHYRDGKLSYVEMVKKVMEQYAKNHAGKTIEEILKVNFDFAVQTSQQVRPFFRDLLATSCRTSIVLVTSEPQTIAVPLAKALDVHSAVSSPLSGSMASNQFVLSGEIHALITPEEKVAATQQAGILPSDIHAAFGDSISDAGILGLAKHAYVVSPSAELRSLAAQHRWTILDDDARLSAKDRRILT